MLKKLILSTDRESKTFELNYGANLEHLNIFNINDEKFLDDGNFQDFLSFLEQKEQRKVKYKYSSLRLRDDRKHLFVLSLSSVKTPINRTILKPELKQELKQELKFTIAHDYMPLDYEEFEFEFNDELKNTLIELVKFVQENGSTSFSFDPCYQNDDNKDNKDNKDNEIKISSSQRLQIMFDDYTFKITENLKLKKT